MKTSELTGAALDWAVAKCEAFKTKVEIEGIVWLLDSRGDISRNFNPSSNWSWGGPIIEREMIQITPHCMVNPLHGWAASYRSFDEDDDVYALFRKRGKTPLIAAMRCYVASKLGDDINIPEELL
jgi:hypothetical protein